MSDRRNLWTWWVWEGFSWRVMASSSKRAELIESAKHAADPPDTWIVVKYGSCLDNFIRRHCKERYAPFPLTHGKSLRS